MRADPAPSPPSEADFTRMFDDAMRRGSNSAADANGTMSRDEQDKFLTAMRDPEFRSLLSDYMAEISDPANRAETEQYLAQLEGEQKVPADKQLVRPTPGFVVKSTWRETAAATDTSPHKLFVNVCSSDKLQPPSSSSVTQPETGKPGTSWHLPYSIGPERLEKDKGGGAAVTFDVCFHPTTLALAQAQRAYRDMVVATCLDAVEGVLRDTRRKSGAPSVSRTSRVLKGVAYKSGEPVTMCLRKPAAGDAASEKTEEASAKTTAKTATPSKKPIDVVPKAAGGASDHLRLDLDKSSDADADGSSPAPLMREVSSTKSDNATAMPPKATKAAPLLRKIAFKLVYRGKFELLHHMQAEHENVVPVDRTRPKELVLEMELPTLTSAAGVDLDVSEQVLKLTAKGYEPLAITLPFPVLEAKGSAKFDKKTQKLVVTLPVQPPPEPTRSPMVIVDAEEEEEEEGDDTDKSDETTARTAQRIASAQRRREPQTEEAAQTRVDDGFAGLRETAIMVQHDPLYMHRARQPASPAAAPADIAFETFDDLPPLESCSEDEGDDEDADLVLVEASPPSAAPDALRAVEAAKAAPFATKETATCLSFIVDVAQIDASSVQLDVPTPTSFALRFAADRAEDREQKPTRELYELRIDALEHEVEPSQAEFDVASENMVVILPKRAASAAVADATPPLATIAPVVRFQNRLLYELD